MKTRSRTKAEYLLKWVSLKQGFVAFAIGATVTGFAVSPALALLSLRSLPVPFLWVMGGISPALIIWGGNVLWQVLDSA